MWACACVFSHVQLYATPRLQPTSFLFYGIFQARILECHATSSSRESSQPRDQTSPALADRFSTTNTTWEALKKKKKNTLKKYIKVQLDSMSRYLGNSLLKFLWVWSLRKSRAKFYLLLLHVRTSHCLPWGLPASTQRYTLVIKSKIWLHIS